MTHRAAVYGDFFLDKARDTYPLARGYDYSGPTFQEFMAGPALAARVQFERSWDSLLIEAGSSIRTIFIPPGLAFGPFVFYGYLIAPDKIEIADFADDPDYWSTVEGDPED